MSKKSVQVLWPLINEQAPCERKLIADVLRYSRNKRGDNIVRTIEQNGQHKIEVKRKGIHMIVLVG